MKKEILNEDLLRRFAKKGYTIKMSRMIFEDVFETMTEVFEEGYTIKINNFGKFVYRIKEEREVISNMVKDGVVVIPKHATVSFTPYRFLKERLNKDI